MKYNFNFFYIAGCIIFTVLGQLLIKHGVHVVNSGHIFRYLFNFFVLSGLCSAVFAALCWIMALQHFELSYAYPFMSLSFFLVAIFSSIFFGEHVSLNQWLGLGIVFTGLVIGSQ